ncbi:nuclear transport factor 2 family protein [Conexibacter stalactiti]|uniref:Nuclear transport factor 2 family protein n=1 Tax=Conexibacter stalactiti TaxID=1940611 RepID=A0ABU4HHE9_9ACTN|nr:nuclear transport factor 2 family protein [Conexibacter stalactiti]MDW5592728.1 nuclear transport factor 2 family protein [Conexibacter stalactiti]MEC5033369.1 nuclear transport factor 2 family protein [Conexibacter stalactiti]
MARKDLISLLRPQVNSARAAIAEARVASTAVAMTAGGVAAGAAAAGAVAIGSLAVKRGAVKRLEIDELVVRRLQVDAHGGVTRAAVGEWVGGYERAWRTAGTAMLAALFTPEATYSPGPYEPTVRGLAAIGEFWDAGRESADEVFTFSSEQVAVDGMVAVVRTEVGYDIPERRHYRNLWVLRFAPDGRVSAFEEWPFWPERQIAGD